MRINYLNPLLFLLSLLGLVGLLPTRFRTRLLAASVIGFVLVSLPFAEWAASRPLEAAYPIRPYRGPADFDAIVVFAENVQPPVYERPFPQPGAGTAERCDYAAWIYRTVKAAPVLACGGSARRPAFAETMRGLLIAGGVPAERIWVETASQNTHQNAVNGARILLDHGIRRVVLVVDARSMPRAAACLRKEGIGVIEAPSRFRSLDPFPAEWLPSWDAIKGNDETLHELVGLALYRLRGWI